MITQACVDLTGTDRCRWKSSFVMMNLSDVFLSSLVFGVWFSCHSCTDRLVLEMGGFRATVMPLAPFLSLALSLAGRYSKINLKSNVAFSTQDGIKKDLSFRAGVLNISSTFTNRISEQPPWGLKLTLNWGRRNRKNRLRVYTNYIKISRSFEKAKTPRPICLFAPNKSALQ